MLVTQPNYVHNMKDLSIEEETVLLCSVLLSATSSQEKSKSSVAYKTLFGLVSKINWLTFEMDGNRHSVQFDEQNKLAISQNGQQ